MRLHWRNARRPCEETVGACAPGRRPPQLRRGCKPSQTRLLVKMPVTDDALERFAQLRERQRVRHRAGKNKINIAVDFEDFTDAIAGARSPPVLAVGWRVMRVCFLQCGPGLGA